MKPRELVDAAISRLEQVNDTLHAVITPMFEQAYAAADTADLTAPFAGVPFLLKDLAAEYAGAPLSEGSGFLDGFVSPIDSEIVARYKRLGLITIGKTNTSEFGLAPTTEPLRFGPTRNPWDPSRTPGGSSGGSATAVAARVVPLAHAGDGGGSIRIPASCCGIFGLKPTRARNSAAPYFGDIMSGLTTEHVVSVTVRDSAAALDATCGRVSGDPYEAPPPAASFLSETKRDPGRLRIALMLAPPNGAEIHGDCIDAAEDAARLCASLGHDVVDDAPDLTAEPVVGAFVTVWAAGAAWTIDHWVRRTGRHPDPDRFEPMTWALASIGRARTAAEYLGAWETLQRAARLLAAFMTRYDLILTPTLGEPPLPLGTLDAMPDDPLAGFGRAGAFVPFTAICNGTGQPAMSVPLHWNNEGLPIGVQFIGRFGDEATLFRLAAQLERARPWAARHPPICAV